METETKAWTPEVGKTAWATFGSQIRELAILAGTFSDEVETNSKEFGVRYIKKSLLHPTAEAALASIKIYDLEGKEVVIPRRRPWQEVIEEYKKSPEYAAKREEERKQSFSEMAKELIDLGINIVGEPENGLPKWEQIPPRTDGENKVMRAFEHGEWPIGELPADPSLVKAVYGPAVFSQVKCKEEDWIFDCQNCGNADGLANFCRECGVKFTDEPIGGLPPTTHIFSVEVGKLAKTETSMDMSYNPNSDQSFSGWQQGRDGK